MTGHMEYVLIHPHYTRVSPYHHPYSHLPIAKHDRLGLHHPRISTRAVIMALQSILNLLGNGSKPLVCLPDLHQNGVLIHPCPLSHPGLSGGMIQQAGGAHGQAQRGDTCAHSLCSKTNSVLEMS